MFQFAGFASHTYVFSMGSPKGWGFPIRRSADQRVLAPPRSLSQRATSFIASLCQGIHEMPLRRLIVIHAQGQARRMTFDSATHDMIERGRDLKRSYSL